MAFNGGTQGAKVLSMNTNKHHHAADSLAHSAHNSVVNGGSKAIFNYEESLIRLGGDSDLFDEILGMFLEDAPALLQQASLSLADGDAETLERMAHTLKGMSANFNAAAAVEASYAVELLARERRLDKAAVCFPRLEDELHRLEAALRNFQQHH